MELLVVIWFYLTYGYWIVLSFSVFATVVHGGEELSGWWGKWPWPLFLVAQSTFIVLAVGGLYFGVSWMVWALVVFRLTDGIGFHFVFFPQWPGRDTRLLPLADAVLLSLWMVTT